MASRHLKAKFYGLGLGTYGLGLGLEVSGLALALKVPGVGLGLEVSGLGLESFIYKIYQHPQTHA